MTGGRRFQNGDTFTIGNVEYRITCGAKGPDDLRLDWRFATTWQPVVLDHVALILDCIGENEDLLYPPPAKGSAYVHEFVMRARREGWRKAVARLQIERANRDERRDRLA
jgi:hypothetical protein